MIWIDTRHVTSHLVHGLQSGLGHLIFRVTAMNRLQSQMQALVDERLMSERRRQIEDLATKVMTLEADRREAKSELRATEQKHQAEGS